MLALAAVYDGASRTEAARIGGVTLQTVRDWVLKLNAHGPDGLIDRRAPGQPSRLNDTHRAALAGVIESGPIPAVHNVVRWRIIDLCWRFMRDNWLSNRVSASDDAIVSQCCDAWSKLATMADRRDRGLGHCLRRSAGPGHIQLDRDGGHIEFGAVQIAPDCWELGFKCA